jgi:hypothetical protein
LDSSATWFPSTPLGSVSLVVVTSGLPALAE